MKPQHEWIRRARVFLMDNYHPPFWPDLTFDAEQLVAAVRKYHANAIRIGSAGKWSVFPNEHWPTHPQLNGRDLIQETIDAARPHGIKVITYVPVVHIIHDANLFTHHPEWRYHPAPGVDPAPKGHHGGGPHRPLCINTPYGDALKNFVKQLVAEHDIDGFYTDSALPYHSHPDEGAGLCYCDYCMAMFRKMYGCDIPYADDTRALPNEQQQLLEAWSLRYGRTVCDVMIELTDWIRQTRDIAVATHGIGVGRWPEPRFMDKVDALLYEAGGEFLHRLEAASLGETSGKAVWQYVGALTAWSRLQVFESELVEEAVASFACGGSILAACGANLSLDDSGRFNDGLADLFSTLESNEPLLAGLHPTHFAAVPYVLPGRVYHELERARFRAEPLDLSDRPLEDVGGVPVRTGAQLNCIKGAFSAMTANHLPVQLIEESRLSDADVLADWPLLILPNIGFLTDAEVAAITRYVDAGGALLATGRTSLYQEAGHALRDNFALCDLLGVDRINCDPDRLDDYHNHFWPAGSFDVYARTVADTWLAKSYPHEIWPINRYELIAPRGDTEVIAHVVFGGREDEPLWPALTCREVGNGRVVYLAAPVEEIHLAYRMPMIRDVLGAIVDWLVPSGRPLEMTGPDQLLAIPNAKPDVQVLFLINHTGERTEGVSEMWPRFSRQFNYVPPVQDVNVRWRMTSPSTPKRVWELSSGADVDFTIDGPCLNMALDRVEQYAMIAASYK